MKKLSAGDIKKFLDGAGIKAEVTGCHSVEIDTYSTLKDVSDGRITWVRHWSDDVYQRLESLTDLIVVAAQQGIQSEKNCYICHEDPKMCFFEILDEFFAEKPSRGIAETAIVKTERIGKDCAVGNYSIISREASIGDRVTIGDHVTILGKVDIGDDAVISTGAVIGKEGFGYFRDLNGHYKKVPHLGGVIIGKGVEIGANTVIDRGTMDDVVIGDYSKIDSLVLVAHNDKVGKDVMIVGGTVLSGSVTVGDGVYIAPGAVIKNQTSIGENSFIGMQTCVVKDVAPGESLFGVPGRGMKREYKT